MGFRIEEVAPPFRIVLFADTIETPTIMPFSFIKQSTVLTKSPSESEEDFD